MEDQNKPGVTVREATINLLRKLALTTVFGNPGSTEEHFLKEFPKDFKYVLALQEASVVGIADGYAIGMEKPVLVNLHTSAGMGNAMGNIIGASLNKTPLLITAGQQTREMLLLEPWLSNVEATRLPRPWVKWSYEPVRAQDLPAAFMRAYATAVQPASGPVFLSLPLDDWNHTAENEAVVRTVSNRVAPDPVKLKEFAAKLSQAKNPALVIGGAVDRSGGWNAAQALAEKLNIPVFAAPAGERVGFSEEHPLFQGALPFAIKPLSEKLKGYDVVLIIGAPVFRYYPYVPGEYLPEGTELLHITDDVAESGRAPVGDSLISDTRLALEVLLDSVTPGAYPAPPNYSVEKKLPEQENNPLTPAEVFFTLQNNRPDNAVLVEESMSTRVEFHKWLPITKPASYFAFASGGLGWALPASIGMSLAERDSGRNRPVIAVLGDGAAQYSIQSLWTAAQLKIPVVMIVLCNSAYTILKSFAEEEETPVVPGLDIPGIDMVSLAKGYGCAAQRVENRDDLAKAIQTALQYDGPTVIEVPTSRDIPPLL
jgi:benzoylformate decarboxylase